MFTREELVFIDNVMNTSSEFAKRQVIKDKIEAVLPYYK
tara:strand:+ start:868 stop:984 length:117 start_codon:yes stop_codon:yes gene_type:complete